MSEDSLPVRNIRWSWTPSRVWQRYILPDPTEVGAASRKLHDLLAKIIVTLLFSIAIGTVVFPRILPLDHIGGDHFFAMAALYALGLLLALVLVSQARLQTACFVVTICIAAVTTGLTLQIEKAGKEGLLSFLIIPGMMATVFMSRKQVLATVTLLLTLMLLVPFFDPYMKLEEVIVGPFFFATIIFGIGTAITKYRRNLEAERVAAITAGNQRYQALLETTHEGFVLVRDGRIIDANYGMKLLFGQLDDLLSEKGIAELFTRDGVPIESMSPGKGETMTAHRGDGTTFQAEVTSNSIVLDGQEVLAISVRDITEKLELEKRMRQGEKMQAIGTLAGGVAHDFNNILSAIVSYSELILAEPSEERQVLEDAEEILSAATRAGALVRQILTFSRQSEVSRQAVEARQVVEEALKLIRASLPPIVEFRIEGELAPGMVVADPIQIQQVVMNLCTNAYDAMKGTGGVVTVSLARVAVGSGEMIELTVSDGGQGMAPEVVERIFEPYFTTKEAGRGTGLGLAVVHGIVAASGGTVEVDSRLGAGTSFRIRLPLADEELSKTRDSPTEAVGQVRGRVLFVDDETALLRAGRRILVRIGLDVETESSPTAALERFRKDPDSYDLVITDQAMPGMSGDHLLLELRKIQPGLPVLLCTGHDEYDAGDEAAERGFDDVILKPFDSQELTSKVSDHLRRAPDR